jgi:hypothetical protein
MPSVTIRMIALAGVAVALAACETASTEKQWYKPGGNYSTAEFDRDLKACSTLERTINEDCMRQRGWTTLSIDSREKPKPQGTPVIPPISPGTSSRTGPASTGARPRY